MRRALEEPLRQIVDNAGEEGAVIVAKVRENKDRDYGYNAEDRRVRGPGEGRRDRPHQGYPYGSAERGSIAALMLTTEAMI